MSPAQALPGADEEVTARFVVRTAPEKAGRDLMCANNSEDKMFHAENEQTKVRDVAEDVEVDVLERGRGCTWGSAKGGDPDATECSSSFGESCLEAAGGFSDTEVDSWYPENGDSVLLDGSDGALKKKRVTDHWRKFVRPIMWRCQWLELRMKELHSQAVLYDKELEAYRHEKQLRSRAVRSNNSASRSVPLTQRQKKRAMRRLKRKRKEDIVDISSYMSNHSVFSYFENRRPETDIQSVDDACDDLDENANDNLEWSIMRFRRSDSALEQILLEIESTQSRVHEMRSRLNEVAFKNVVEMPSTQAQLFPEGLHVSHAESPSISPDNDGDGAQVGLISPAHHLSEYEMDGMAVPGSAVSVSSYGDATEYDMIDSQMGLFSAADIPLDQHEIAGLCRAADDDDVLIDNQAAEEGLQNFERVSHTLENPRYTVKEEVESSSSEEPSTASEFSIPESCRGSVRPDLKQTPILKACYSGKKRGRKPKKKRRTSSGGGSGGAKNAGNKKHRVW